MHQAEYCTSAWSNNVRNGQFEDFISVPNSGEGYCWLPQSFVHPPKIVLSRPSLTHGQTSYIGCCRQHTIPLWHLYILLPSSHVHNMNPSVRRTRCQRWTRQFWCSLANTNWAAWCWVVCTGLTTGCQASNAILTAWQCSSCSSSLKRKDISQYLLYVPETVLEDTLNFYVTAHLDVPSWWSFTPYYKEPKNK